jgi:integrase
MALPVPSFGRRDYGYRLVGGKGGVSVRVRVAAADKGANRRVEVDLYNSTNPGKRWQLIGVSTAAEDNVEALRQVAIKMHAAAREPEGHPKTQPTLVEVCRRYFVEKIHGKRREAKAWERVLNRYIAVCRHATVPFRDMRREQFKELLDEVRSPPRNQKNEPPWEQWPLASLDMRALVFVKLHAVCRWWQDEVSDSYTSPLSSKNNPYRSDSKRDTAGKRGRKRWFSDEEIVAFWHATENPRSVYSALVRMMLLTGLRREVVASMKFTDIRNGVWYPPRPDGGKVVPKDLMLPQLALDIVLARRQGNTSAYVFPGYNPNEHFHGWPKDAEKTGHLLSDIESAKDS